MSGAKTLTFYLEPEMRKRAESGQINFVNKIVSAFASCGFQSLFKGNSATELLRSADDSGYSLFFMEEPFHPRSLTMRLTYFYPFWRIETSSKRWEWEVSETEFDPETIDADEAKQFFQSWRKRLFKEADAASSGDFVYVPLQGLLLQKRSFQAMSPVEMLRTTMTEEPELPVHATLHPKETYTPAEMEALDDVAADFPNFVVSAGDAHELVSGCRYIVTQNSGVTMAGYFHQKPAVLFGKIDFHHIAANIHQLGVEKAFKNVRSMNPDYAKYLFWFLQVMSINAGRPDAEEKILATVRSHGWDI